TPAVAAHQLVPLGDDVVDRTAVVTERDAAIHAARTLLAHLGRRQRQDELLPGLEARLDLLVRPFPALDLEEALHQAHDFDNSPALSSCARRRILFRRYSLRR